jgi:phosphoglycolate phosphatase
MLKHVIWDWNGTLLNDLDLCVSILNEFLAKKKLPAVSRGFYREHFGFPVKAFYELVGFDFEREDFAELSRDFNDRYKAQIARASLQPDATAALSAVKQAGLSQSIVSATHQDMLGAMLDHFGLRRYFSRIKGLDDHHATSKIGAGIELVQELRLPAEGMLFVGDTLHDLETARAIGCRCVLFSGGHQSRRRLATTEVPVFQQLRELIAMLSATVSRSEAV